MFLQEEITNGTTINNKLLKGKRRMPRLLWATKDVVSCEKPWGFANEN